MLCGVLFKVRAGEHLTASLRDGFTVSSSLGQHPRNSFLALTIKRLQVFSLTARSTLLSSLCLGFISMEYNNDLRKALILTLWLFRAFDIFFFQNTVSYFLNIFFFFKHLTLTWPQSTKPWYKLSDHEVTDGNDSSGLWLEFPPAPSYPRRCSPPADPHQLILHSVPSWARHSSINPTFSPR